MIYKYKDSNERKVGDELSIRDLLAGNNLPMDLVIAKLNGFHGTFVNCKSTKHYFMIEGNAKITINDEIYELEKGDLAVVPINAKHSIEGNGEFALMCMPSYDPNFEEIL